MFRAENLGLDNLLGGSSLKKTDSPSLSCHSLPIALYLGVGSYEISLLYIGISHDVVTV